MGQPAAKQGDTVVAVDTHVVIVPGVGTSPLPHPFVGTLTDSLSQDVMIMGMPAAIVGSVAQNSPAHIPTPPGTSFNNPPANQGTVQNGSPTVTINGQPAARAGDTVKTCNDPADLPVGTILATGTVLIG
jgi:uncharacterized Zn-binding protein involved in type VI secretion